MGKKLICPTCRRPVTDWVFKTYGQCENCWEVESRIDEYLRSSRGEQKVIKALARKHEAGR